VSKALKRVKGVATVKASYQTKEAVVTFDDTSTSLEALQNATANAGYPSALKK
jgi:mercuric ion binding protein